ncbi:MAG: hypothetical protein LQ340_007209 [Diploschistes diacapsis]|nr:MAG: hypothetical protein LQ340_007209 [Diploschistes diacapsis]
MSSSKELPHGGSFHSHSPRNETDRLFLAQNALPQMTARGKAIEYQWLSDTAYQNAATSASARVASNTGSWENNELPNSNDWGNNANVQQTLPNNNRARRETNANIGEVARTDYSVVPARNSSTAPTSPKCLKRSILDARIEEIGSQKHWVESSPDDDTFVFIDPPSLPSHASAYRSSYTDTDIQDQFSRPFPIQSRLIKSLQSPFFDRMFSDRYQSSLRSKRCTLPLPPGFKYVLDLTPKSEGDEAVQYVEDLSCPVGVLHWPESNARWEVSPTLVLGRDEFTSDMSEINKRWVGETGHTSQDGPAQNKERDQGEAGSDSREGAHSTNGSNAVFINELIDREKEPEYTPTRHRLAIRRFLRALKGQDPWFDSAVKVYTTVMVSKAFDIRGLNPVTDYAARWLCAEPNSRFIEALPEVTLKMAEVTRTQVLASDAFAVLVGEAVLDGAVNYNSPNMTFLGRRREPIDESWQSRIEYARNSLTDRVKETFDILAGEQMEWLHELNSMKLLRQRGPSQSAAQEDAYQSLAQILKGYVRGAIYHILCSKYHSLEGLYNVDKKGGDMLYPRQAISYPWNTLSPSTKIYTRVFWDLLSSVHFRDHYYCETSTEDMSTNKDLVQIKRAFAGRTENSSGLGSTSLYKTVRYSELAKAVRLCQGDHSATGKNLAHTTKDARPCTFFGCMQDRPLYFSKCLHCLRRFCYDHIDVNSHVCSDPIWDHANDWDASEGINTIEYFPDSAPRGYSDTEPFFRQPTASTNPGASVTSLGHILDEGAPYRNSAGGSLFGTAYYGGPNRDDVENSNARIVPQLSSATTNYDETSQGSFSFSHEVHIEARQLMKEVGNYVQDVGRMISGAAEGGQLGRTVDVYLTTTLLCLNEAEIKYLPLWAGGLDDGTSGVYTGAVPHASDGFTGPPAATNELGVPGLGGDYDMADDCRTIATSAMANDAYGNTMHDKKEVCAVRGIEPEYWSYVPKGARAQDLSSSELKKGDILGVISDSGMLTPAGATTPQEEDTLDDIFDQDEEFGSDDDFAAERLDNGDQGKDDAMGYQSSNNPDSYVLDTESVSYGGFSDPESSVMGTVAPTHTTHSTKPQSSAAGVATPTHTTGSSEPEYVDLGKAAAKLESLRAGNTTSSKRPVANDVGSEIKSANADDSYRYKDDPEDELLTRP